MDSIASGMVTFGRTAAVVRMIGTVIVTVGLVALGITLLRKSSDPSYTPEDVKKQRFFGIGMITCAVLSLVISGLMTFMALKNDAYAASTGVSMINGALSSSGAGRSGLSVGIRL